MSGIVYPNTMFYKECYKILSQPGYVSYIVAPFLSSPLPASSPPSPASAFTTSSSATSSSSHWQWSLFLQKLLTSEINSLFQHCLLCITSFSTSGVIAVFIWCSSKAYSIFNTLKLINNSAGMQLMINKASNSHPQSPHFRFEKQIKTVQRCFFPNQKEK